MKTIGQIKKICAKFIEELGDAADGELTFVLLAEEAKARGLELRAEQRGISGTYVHFVKDEGRR